VGATTRFPKKLAAAPPRAGLPNAQPENWETDNSFDKYRLSEAAKEITLIVLGHKLGQVHVGFGHHSPWCLNQWRTMAHSP